MKTTKRLITTILALSILLSVLAGITASALALNEDLIIEESSPEEELIPMGTNSCSLNYSLYYPDGRIYANVHFDHSHGGIQPHVHVYTWHQGPNGSWNSSHKCVEYDSTLFPRP